jgi:F-type H+-transporting ATPase subunit delta
MSDDRLQRDAQAVAAMHANVGVEHIADVYAEALIQAAEAAGETEAVLDEFASLVDDVFAAMPQFERVLASGLVSHEEKVGLLDRALGGRASRQFLNFLKVVSRHERMDCLRPMLLQARKYCDRLRRRVPVEVTSAIALDVASVQRIGAAIGRVVAGEPVLAQAVDPALIGGMVVRVGDTVFDASVAAQLQQMRQKMVDRSAHEIQSRRDRFRHSE